MELTNKQLRNVANTIGDRYRIAVRQMESMESDRTVSLNMQEYKDAADYVKEIDRTLDDCTEDTRLIIRKECLSMSESGWYENYYSRNTYYRLRKKAVIEFLRLLFAKFR